MKAASAVVALVGALAGLEACGWIVGDAQTVYVAPDASSLSFDAGPEATLPEGSGPDAAPEAAPDAAPEAAPDAAPEAAPDAARPPPSNPALGLSAWGKHVCAVRSDGTVACWGDDYGGVLGNASPLWTYTPTTVIDGSGAPVAGATAVAVGNEHGCALVAGGAITCWGAIRHFATAPMSDGGAGQLAAKGWVYSADQDPFGDLNCVVDGQGMARCWGSNSHDALGHAAGTAGDVSCDDNISCNSTPSVVSGLPAVRRIALGDGGGCAVTMAGNVACWGWNSEGQLGTSDAVDSPAAVTILLANGQPLAGVTDVFGGHNTFCALQSTGKLYCWGHTYEYETGLAADGGSDTVTPVEFDNGAIPGITGATIGQRHICVVAGSNVWCAGWNPEYEMGGGAAGGNTSGCTFCAADPVRVLGPDGHTPLAGVVELAAGWSSTCARTGDGELYCWGLNDTGQTGHKPGTLTDVVCVSGYCTPYATRVDTF